MFDGAPESAQRAVRDAAPAEDSLPLVIYSHGATSHRRSASILCTHLASHGYAVAALDHPGSMIGDLMHDLADDAPPRLDMESSQADRPSEVCLAIDRLLDGSDLASGLQLDAERVGVCGVSFGGWTTLMVAGRDERIRSAFPIVPAFGKGPLGTELFEADLDLGDWGRDVPTLLLAAEKDALIMLQELRRLYSELCCTKRMVVLRGAGHVHFVDGAEQRHEMVRQQFKSGVIARAGGLDLCCFRRWIT